MLLQDFHYLHALNLLPNFGPIRLLLLAKHFKTFKLAYQADIKQMKEAGIDEKIGRAFFIFRKKINLEEEAKRLEQEKINILTFRDPKYPRLLLQIPKFPPILYYKGKMNEPEEFCVAAVGTRKVTDYGKAVIPSLIEPLADKGITIVSGMALGVDAICHQISVNKKKRTIAVLGGGLDEQSLYPKQHALLAEEIINAGGALLSEYPIGTPNFKEHFVARNRIISGLSVATLVIECGIKSGTLITARHALDQNRQVFAVPGPINSPLSEGANALLKMGAKPVTSAADIFEDLNLKA